MSSSFNRRGMIEQLSPLRVDFSLSVLSGMALVLVLGSSLGREAGVAVALAVFCLGAASAAFGMHRFYAHDEFGLCNLITMSRLALTASLAALMMSPAPPQPADLWLAFGVALAALALDGVDGWAARRAGLASGFGARFDMEVDSLLALVLALLAYETGQVGPWVVALGLPRYAFVVAGFVWPDLTREIPDSFGRKAVCVVQIGTLVAFLVPVLPATLLTAAAAFAAMALIWSFARDIRLLTSADG